MLIMITDKPKPEQSNNLQESSVLICSENYDSIVERIFVFLEYGEWENASSYAEQALNCKPKAGILYLAKLMAELQVRTREELKNLDEPFDGYDNCIKASDFDEEIANELKADNKFIRERIDLNLKQEIYNNAKQKLESAKTEDDFQSIIRVLSQIKGFADSEELTKQCLEKVKTVRKEEIYNRAVELFEEGTSGILTPPESVLCVEDAITKFNSVIEWRNSIEKMEECNIALDELKFIKQEYLERKAEEDRIKAEEEKIKAKKLKKRTIITAVAALLFDVIVVLLSVFVLDKKFFPEVYYQKALSEVEAGNYEKAVFLFNMNSEYKDTKEQVDIAKNKEIYPKWVELLKRMYTKATAYYKSGDYTNAILWFEDIKVYSSKWNIDFYEIVNVDDFDKDLDWWLEESYIAKFGLNGYEEAKKLEELEVGDIFIFGNYYKSNSNKKEPIEWIVVAKGDIGMCVLSKNIIDYYEEDEWSKYKYWRNWGLKDWLNNYFLNTAFDDKEQKFILSYDSFTGDMGEKIKLLASDNFLEIQNIPGVFDCKATKYAISKGAKKNSETGCFTYWLMPYSNGQLCYVKGTDGSYWIYDYAPAVGHGVRPFMVLQYK